MIPCVSCYYFNQFAFRFKQEEAITTIISIGSSFNSSFDNAIGSSFNSSFDNAIGSSFNSSNINWSLYRLWQSND